MTTVLSELLKDLSPILGKMVFLLLERLFSKILMVVIRHLDPDWRVLLDRGLIGTVVLMAIILAGWVVWRACPFLVRKVRSGTRAWNRIRY